MKYRIFNHQGKCDAYISALDAAGFISMEKEQYSVDFVLTDHAIRYRRDQLCKYWDYDVNRFFVYPHAARPNLVNDITDEWKRITAHFVAAPGHVWVMRAYGYSKPIHVVGWHLCPVREFQPRQEARRVLFAPIHYRCAEEDQAANHNAYEHLMKLVESGQIELTVRHIGDLGACGIRQREHPNVHYTTGNLKPSWHQIDQSDVVVGHQTFAWLAVARGIPTVMFGDDIVPHLMTDPIQYARSWDEYREMLAFPLALNGSGDTLETLQRACQPSQDVECWKKRMIGSPFDGEAFVEIVESYL